MKKVMNIAFWAASLVVVFALWGFASSKQAVQKCTGLAINIEQNGDNFFVSQNDIKANVFGQDSVINTPLNKYNISTIEKEINAMASVKNAQVYKTINGVLHISVTQRKPIARVYPQNGESYYIDESGKLMPVSNKFTADVMVFSGNINETYDKYYQLDFKQLEDSDSLAQKINLINIYKLATLVYTHPFWKAQIEQSYVNKDLTFTLIPRVGNHTIVIGKSENLKQKFEKLRIFYKQGLAKVGWNKYKSINLTYKNQIVCTKN